MGVAGLWSLIEPVKKEVKLSDCQGKKLAVDLSSWIVKFSSAAPHLSMRYKCYRNLFFRTLDVLSMGVSLVFVLDGPNPPKLKHKAQSRDAFYQITLEYKAFLEAMGIPVLESDGEAEKMCALLNKKNVVDGVLTEDGDAFMYGANKVYKNFTTDKGVKTVDEYKMTDIQSELGLTHKDLLAFSLVSKGDFSKGIAHVGVETFWKLYNELKQNNVDDILKRLLEWKSNARLDSLKSLQNDLKSVEKARHCTRCSHEGTKQSHSVSGCGLCSSTTGCLETPPTGAIRHPPCCCKYHSMEADIKPYSTELKVRSLALEQEHFPQEDVVEEFLVEGAPPPENFSPSLSLPDFNKVCEILQTHMNFSRIDTLRHLAPACMKMKMYGLLPQIKAQPLRVEKTCKVVGEQCYLVKWSKLEIEGFSDDGDVQYELKIPISHFREAYPEIASQFESTRSPPKPSYARAKRKNEMAPGQKAMTDMFKVVKKPNLDRPPSLGAACSSVNSTTELT